MIQSMTGFGKATTHFNDKKISIELKSLNSKAQDLNSRIAANYREKELTIRNIILQKLERGKIDFSLSVEITGEETISKINVPVVKGYMHQLQELNQNLTETELLPMVLRLPDVLKTERDGIDENEWTAVENTLNEAIKNLQNFRANEGKKLADEFMLRIENIRKFLVEALVFENERTETVKKRLQNALTELAVKVDENRFEQELIYYLEKFDITEEKVRLSNHLDYFLQTLHETTSNGRKLGFICQEMGREINTLGSKANHAEMQKCVVNMKDELEKIKEQMLNIL